MISNNKKNLIYIIPFIIGIIGYLISIFWININGRQWVFYDVYSDAMAVKYIAEAYSCFPSNWAFGNQLYVVATPNLAALIYYIVNDSYLALAIASCVMTCLTIGTFVWCLYPFAKIRSIIVGVFCLIGAVNIGISASGDPDGLHVFFTMASYYACYVIGIFITLGVWLRTLNNTTPKKNSHVILIIVFLLNFALGIQSLRETLVLNIPLCITCFLPYFIKKKELRTVNESRKSILFVFGALITNLSGVLFVKILAPLIHIRQSTILSSPTANIIENIKHIYNDIRTYAGLTIPNWNWHYSVFEFIVGVILLNIVAFAIIHIIITIIRSRTCSPLGYLILFCTFSLLAVIAVGILFIWTRSIYFFVWYILVSFSVVYIFELKHSFFRFKIVVALIVLISGAINYQYCFVSDYQRYEDSHSLHQTIVAQLEKDEITCVYTDYTTGIGEITPMSHDKIICATIDFTDDTHDLVSRFNYLYADDWFDDCHMSTSYVMLSNSSFSYIQSMSTDYQEALMSQLTPVFQVNDEYFFYKASNRFFEDMNNNFDADL